LTGDKHRVLKLSDKLSLPRDLTRKLSLFFGTLSRLRFTDQGVELVACVR
jgi:hypothetical protein